VNEYIHGTTEDEVQIVVGTVLEDQSVASRQFAKGGCAGERPCDDVVVRDDELVPETFQQDPLAILA